MRKLLENEAAQSPSDDDLGDTSDFPDHPNPAWSFLYGALMDPERLARAAGLDELPQTEQAAVYEQTIKYRGFFPVLSTQEGRRTDFAKSTTCYIPTF
jgi:hypothetical protein